MKKIFFHQSKVGWIKWRNASEIVDPRINFDDYKIFERDTNDYISLK